jgi:folate-dependent phosphoribosylglycinamide formyltransferase PurN
MKIWIALFSQTGSEIVDISSKLDMVPRMIMTNNIKEDIPLNPAIRGMGKHTSLVSAKHDVLMDFLENQTTFPHSDVVITLHGYLRIIPEKICNMYTIYNGHPGAIELYPELKGKDPQARAWSGKYDRVGSVVHRVTPGVDEGEVIQSVVVDNTAKSLDEMFGILKQTSLQSWLMVMKGVLE